MLKSVLEFILLTGFLLSCSGHDNPTGELVKDGDCREMCKTSSGCPSDDVMRRMMMTDKDCRECVQDQCGNLASSNGTSLMTCIVEARAGCEKCPTPGKPGRMAECMSCLRKCPRAGKRETGMTTCRRRCVFSLNCPSTNGIMTFFQNTTLVNSQCRECVMGMCDTDSAEVDEKAICMFNAREECEDCGISSAAQSTRQRCSSCITRCRQGGRTGSLTPTTGRRPSRFPAQGGGKRPRPGTRPEVSCKRRCELRGQTCPTTNQILVTIRSKTSSECQECIRDTCGSSQGTSDEMAMCWYNARATCSVCTMSEGVRSQRERCDDCISKCDQANQNTDSLVPLVSVPAGTSNRPMRTCQQRCTSPSLCPSPREVIVTIRNRTTTECQECVMESCGNPDDEVVGGCMYMARESCSVCDISEGARRRRRRCSSCLEGCEDRSGVGEAVGAVKPEMMESPTKNDTDVGMTSSPGPFQTFPIFG
ncbi:uncharacterized protein LOC143461586 isoform X2 [Clavelina lepadiformis]|uniref:uncharacterized protein LOC143461586 isoform X2 n=1 Tax=Clavelina lepadiformis TaxID=159417 RepID=UPI004041B34C